MNNVTFDQTDETQVMPAMPRKDTPKKVQEETQETLYPHRQHEDAMQHTQKLPRATLDSLEEWQKEEEQAEGSPIQPPIPKRTEGSGVRRLSPLEGKGGKHAKKSGFWTPKKKKGVILTCGFLIALMIGFILAGWAADRKDLANSQKQIASMEEQNRQDQRKRDEESLRQQKAELQQKLEDLEKQQKQLESQSDRMQGRNDQIQDDRSGSFVQKAIDKVTGKDKKRQEQAASNQQQKSAADREADSVQQSIQQVQTMMDDVDNKLEAAEAVKSKVSAVGEGAKQAYQENEGVINQALGYAKKGASVLWNLLQ